MTLFQVDELAVYWRKHPPVHLLVAGFVGFKSDDDRPQLPPGDEYYPVSTGLPPEFYGVPGIEPGQLPAGMENAIFDFDELMRQ